MSKTIENKRNSASGAILPTFPDGMMTNLAMQVCSPVHIFAGKLVNT